MFTDLYLRAADEAALKAALPWAVHDADVPDGPSAGDWKTSEPGLYALDLIGPITVTDAVLDEDGETVLTPPVVDEGFHANLRLIGAYTPNVPAEVIVQPTAPRRVFA
ncbi:MAG: hypothetical protein ABL308_12645 [Oceanicaulis sp.]